MKLKEIEMELSRLREIRATADGVALVPEEEKIKAKVTKRFGKLYTIDGEKVIKITNNNFNKLRVGNLDYISDEGVNRKR